MFKFGSSILLFIIIGTLVACTPQEAESPTPLPVTEPASVVVEPTLAVAASTPTILPTAEAQLVTSNTYSNSDFGLVLQYPADWFGPDEYVSEQTLRVEVGSDTVYPYGQPPDEPSSVKNSYQVVVQYSQNDQNQYWKDTLQSLSNLQDGETQSDNRGMIIKVRTLDFGRFKGVEYISTLSETAQTQPVFIREVVLIDEQSNLLTILGTPNNVEIGDGSQWREIYQMIDEENQTIFHEIVASITVE